MTSAISERLSQALANRYRIERELGQGGMATVYLASDLRHDRKIALKVLRPELAAVIGAERFLAEIKTTANLQHPHILPLFDSGEADSFLFYAMPFVEGETLRVRLNREKQLPIADAIRIASEVASALDYAHRHNVIHRDIKPENILLHDGSALVADFGIALAASKAGSTRMTETGMSLGTPHYMSPEQAMGEREITARSDIFSLGCVLYEMLLGEPPFTGPTAQSIVAKVMSERPALLTPRRERIPAGLEAATLTALEKLPADRFATAAEFAVALTATPDPRLVTGAGTKPATVARTGIDWRVAGAGILLGAALTAGVFATRGSSSGEGASGTRSQLTFNGRSWAPAISPDGEYVAYVDIRCPRGPRNPCTSSLLVQGRGSDRPVVIWHDALGIASPRFTQDGNSLVVSAQLDAARVGLFVLPRLGGVPRRIGPAGVFDTHASGDSAIVVVPGRGFADAKALVIALASGATTDTIPLPPGPIDGMAWSPDGSLLALVAGYAKLTIVRRNGTVSDSMKGPFRPTVRFAPDGGGVLVFRALPVKEDNLDEYSVDGGGRVSKTPQVRVPAIQTLLVGDFDVARRTGAVAMISGGINFDLWTFDLASPTTPARRRTSGTTWYGAPVITPDGRKLLYMRGDATGDNLYVLNEDDSEEALTAERFPGIAAAAVSRDGSTAVFGHATPGGARFGVMDLATRQATYFTPSGISSNAPPALVNAAAVFLKSDLRGLLIHELPGGKITTLDVPDSLRVGSFGSDRSGDSVAVMLATRSGLQLAISPLARWAPRLLLSFDPSENTGGLNWGDDGIIHFWRWPSRDDAPGVWRIAASGGSPARVRSLPTACDVPALSVAVAAKHGACPATDSRGDVWLLRVPGVTR